jgi:hypothetical protein
MHPGCALAVRPRQRRSEAAFWRVGQQHPGVVALEQRGTEREALRRPGEVATEVVAHEGGETHRLQAPPAMAAVVDLGGRAHGHDPTSPTWEDPRPWMSKGSTAP